MAFNGRKEMELVISAMNSGIFPEFYILGKFKVFYTDLFESLRRIFGFGIDFPFLR